MTMMSKRFSYGKSLEQLRQAKQERGEKFRQPKLWSETRFAAHAADTFKTFQENEAAMRHVLAAQTLASGKDDKDLQKLKGMYDTESRDNKNTFNCRNIKGILQTKNILRNLIHDEVSFLYPKNSVSF